MTQMIRRCWAKWLMRSCYPKYKYSSQPTVKTDRREEDWGKTDFYSEGAKYEKQSRTYCHLWEGLSDYGEISGAESNFTVASFPPG